MCDFTQIRVWIWDSISRLRPMRSVIADDVSNGLVRSGRLTRSISTCLVHLEKIVSFSPVHLCLFVHREMV